MISKFIGGVATAVSRVVGTVAISMISGVVASYVTFKRMRDEEKKDNPSPDSE